jgi:phospho-acceptor domain-containing protein
MSSIGAITIDARPGQSTGVPSGAKDVCTGWPKTGGHGHRGWAGSGPEGHGTPGGATLGGPDSTSLDRLAVLGEIATLLAHEVKNPLRAMLLNAKAALNWLSAEQANIQEAQQAIAAIVESGKLARELIAILDNLARAQAGERRPLDVNESGSGVLARSSAPVSCCERRARLLLVDLGEHWARLPYPDDVPHRLMRCQALKTTSCAPAVFPLQSGSTCCCHCRRLSATDAGQRVPKSYSAKVRRQPAATPWGIRP